MAATLAAAETYLATNCLYTAAWDAADAATRQKALSQAVSEIGSLPWRPGAPAVNIEHACYEQAVFLLETQGNQDRINIQAAGVSHVAIAGGASETYHRGATRYGFALAPGAQRYTRGWLATVGTTR
jgi:hypothetical protein